MLTRPINNTAATEATAIGIRTILRNVVIRHTYHPNGGSAIAHHEIRPCATIWPFMY
jgi:hypothetical protein